MKYIPPFKITPLILKLSQDISRELGLIIGRKLADTPLTLRRSNNIKSIQASLAIEGNTLSLNQVTALLEGRRVIGPPKDILEVQNAFILYEDLHRFNPLKVEDMLKAHAILMAGLIEENGKWRTGGVGILKGNEVSHIAPPAKRVPILMEELFNFLAHSSDISWLIKACIFHYEFEFIHPFSDGNGRMGRFWQQLLLMKEDALFEFIPVEVLIKQNQEEYYNVLGESDNLGESTPFIEFSLKVIYAALKDYSQTAARLPQDHRTRLLFAQARIKENWFSRKDYLELHADISTATASRDLLFGIQEQILKNKGEKNQVRYQFIKT